MPDSEIFMRLDKMLSNLGYASRKRVPKLLKSGLVKVDGQTCKKPETKVSHSQVSYDGAALDPLSLVIALHKPVGYICSHKEDGELVYELLPERFLLRNPKLSCVGRLDKDSSGLIIITDDGNLNHVLTSPKHAVKKVYEVSLERDLRGNEVELFASGTLQLPDEEAPLLPAELEIIAERHVRITLREGRNRQVRRMFEATGNFVTALRRIKIAGLELGELPEGSFYFLTADDVRAKLVASKSLLSGKTL